MTQKISLAKFGFAALTALIVSACGSSDGGGNNDPQPITPTQPSQPNVGPSQPAQPSQPNVEHSQPAQPNQPNVEPSQPAQPNQPNVEPSQPTQPNQPNVEPSQPTQPNQPNVEPSQPTQPNQPNVEPSQPNQSSIIGDRIGYIIPRAGGNIQVLKVSDADPDMDINRFDIEGKTIELVPPSFFSKVFRLEEGGVLTHYVGADNRNIRWGLIADKDLENKYLIAYGTNLTENMPQSGSAKYEGGGVHAYSSTNNKVDTIIPTKVSLKVDFAEKTLVGEITPLDQDNIPVSAKIDGNRFSGITDAGTQTEGRFYGNNANELAGNYVNEKETFLGTFGAQKQ